MKNWITPSCPNTHALAFALALGAVPLAGVQAQGRVQVQAQVVAEFTPAATVAPEIVLSALAYLGVPYRYGGNDPVTGFDCSGLVRHVFHSATAMQLPRSAQEMARLGMPVAAGELQPGDLVFFNTRGRAHSHVGIYMGDGSFVHAPARRGQVKVESMDLAYWQRRYNGARRIVPPDAAAQISAAQALPVVFSPGPIPPE
jgi:cell wall-associated NlpC family hydrolase